MRILDMGSGNTSKNDITIIKKMIDALAEVDPERKFIIKWQLFKDVPPNIPLEQKKFAFAYYYAESLGYKITASVFDIASLEFLLIYNIPFVKIANRPDLYWLIGEVPRKIPVIVSYNGKYNDYLYSHDEYDINYELCCISEYPTNINKYNTNFEIFELKQGISDHTSDWQLYLKYRPEIYECHFKLPDSTGPDAGSFARTPDDIKNIYEEL